jgi:hypothetical protein
MTLKETFENTVFLLGAGASYEANCLISKAMLGKLHQAILDIPQDHILYKDYKSAFVELYQFIRPSLSFQSDLRNIRSGGSDLYSPNIEDYILIIRKIINKDYIIPEPLVGSWSERLMRLEIKYENIFETYLNFIYEKVIEWITPTDNYNTAAELLAPFATLLKQTNDEIYHINIFTLNYDLIFEKVLNINSEFPVNTRFNSDGLWNAKWFDSEDAKINLSKIHGSLDWYLNEDDTCCLTNHEVAFNPLNPDERKPHIILGFEYKLFSVDPFFTLLQQFIQKLKTSKLLVVIGYSFFDNYLNNIIIRHLNSNENGRVLIVDPYWASKDNPEEDFLKYLKQIQADTSNMNLNNYTTLYSSRIEFYQNEAGLNSGAKNFYADFLSDKCDKLSKFIEQINNRKLEF